MSWMTTLYETYENIIKQGSKELLPIAHSTQNAHIELTLNAESEMIDASLVAKEDAVTLIPVTESSASRTSGSSPHPLCDKLQYLAADYEDFGGSNNIKHHTEYMEQLRAWSVSEFSTKKVEVIYKYLEKGRLISDLVGFGILKLDESGKLLDKYEAEGIKMSAGKQIDSFIRFRVVIKEDEEESVWQDLEILEAYTNYYLSKLDGKNFCYAKGEFIPCTTNHPSKIRNSGDKAKLISSNDTTNFTFKGRFHNAEEATTIGYEISQKAHNALKWLIEKQGQRADSKVFVLWGTHNEKTPNVFDDTLDFVDDFFERFDKNHDEDITKSSLSEQFNLAIRGYKAEINPQAKLALMGIDAATTGRMSIIFFREYIGTEGHELIDNIKNWHEQGAWRHSYRFKNKKAYPFYGAPAPKDIVSAAYGTEQDGFIKADDKIASNAIERLLPCIIDGKRVPKDIAHKLIEKSKHPQNYENIYNWYKVLTITCAVYRKYLYDYKKEEYSMEVKQTDNLAYNCGRLLAVADAIEAWALKEGSNSGDIRTTNALRYFTRFSISPAKTWGVINDKLVPYKQRLGAKGSRLYKLLGEISSLIDPEDFKNAANLDGCMVLGFDTQRQALYKKNTEKTNSEEDK